METAGDATQQFDFIMHHQLASPFAADTAFFFCSNL